MNRIRLLPEHVANQIAAGEVVERPASVVKELVENSIDAQATRIIVEIQAGGRSLIRVTDDGIGMSRDDALMCLERHATSKILTAEDLARIKTMGFRGEAIPSIASVSKFTLTTRERDSSDPEATNIVVMGGKIVSVKAAGAPHGTCVEVRQLFYNLPARRKFLRTKETEEAHIQHYLSLVAMAYPEIAFDYIRDGKLVWQLPPVKNLDPLSALKERLRALQKWEPQFIPVEAAGELEERFQGLVEEDAIEQPVIENTQIKLSGFIGAPGVSRATRDDQYIFVNKRPIESKALNYALLEGYHTALMKGRYPVCCLFLEIDPAAVDVNIHPTKREVKFRNERSVRQFVANAIRESLLKLSAKDSLQTAEIKPRQIQEIQSEPQKEIKPRIAPESSQQLDLKTTQNNTPLAVEAQPLFQQKEIIETPAPAVSTQHKDVEQTRTTAPTQLQIDKKDDKVTRAAIDEPVPLLKVPLRYLGVIGKLYVVMESDKGLVLLDQHAAHERVLFEQMLERFDRGEVFSQRLLLPETFDLSPRDADFMRRQIEKLNKLGIGLHEFGETTFLLDSLPQFFSITNTRQFIIDLIDELKMQALEIGSGRLGEEMIARSVCRHAVKANDPLTEQELMKLIEDLKQCQMPYTCPHGRPTIIEINYRELAKKFGRIV